MPTGPQYQALRDKICRYPATFQALRRHGWLARTGEGASFEVTEEGLKAVERFEATARRRKTTEWVLWGIKYVPRALKITGGTIAHCRRERASREQEGGWVGLVIYREGAEYPKDVEHRLLCELAAGQEAPS